LLKGVRTDSTATQLQKQIEIVRGQRNDTLLTVTAKLTSDTVLKDTSSRLAPTVVSKYKTSYRSTQVFTVAPTVTQLQKQFEVIRDLSNNFTNGTLQKSFEVVRGLRTDALFNTAKTQAVQVIRDIPNKLNIIPKTQTVNAVRGAGADTALTQVAKTAAVQRIYGVRNENNLPVTTYLTPPRASLVDIKFLLSVGSAFQPPVVTARTAQVFFTPTPSSLNKYLTGDFKRGSPGMYDAAYNKAFLSTVPGTGGGGGNTGGGTDISPIMFWN
jgi:hypothetical protein